MTARMLPIQHTFLGNLQGNTAHFVIRVYHNQPLEVGSVVTFAATGVVTT